MSHKIRRLTAAEQTAEHMREEIRSGRWDGKLPGVLALAAEFDVSPATMRGAIHLLERDGLIHSAGAGRSREVHVQERVIHGAARPLRVTILPGMRLVDEDAAFQKIVMHLQHELELSGHVCRIAPKSQEDLGHHVGRIKRFVNEHPADAWVVIGPNGAVVEWFGAQPTPAICIGGQIIDTPIASTGMTSRREFGEVARHLVGLGHRRILFLWPQYRAAMERDPFIEQLAQALADVGNQLSSYHVPVWKATPQGLRDILEKTFQFTPPTAIITTYGKWMAGVLSFLAARGLRAPRDISLFSLNEDDWFAWKEPQISCLRGDDLPMVRRIVRWVDAVTRGKADRTFIGFPMIWERGGTIGPAPDK